VTAGAVRVERIFDEARETADPVRLIGLSNQSATRYGPTAHPDKRFDPTAP
jgi:hypothetical protein